MLFIAVGAPSAADSCITGRRGTTVAFDFPQRVVGVDIFGDMPTRFGLAAVVLAHI